MQFKDRKELNSMSDKELGNERKAADKHLTVIGFEHSQGNLKDTSQLSKVGKYIAYIETILSQRQRTVAKA